MMINFISGLNVLTCKNTYGLKTKGRFAFVNKLNCMENQKNGRRYVNQNKYICTSLVS